MFTVLSNLLHIRQFIGFATEFRTKKSESSACALHNPSVSYEKGREKLTLRRKLTMISINSREKALFTLTFTLRFCCFFILSTLFSGVLLSHSTILKSYSSNQLFFTFSISLSLP